MSHPDKTRESHARSARTHSRSRYRLRIGHVTVSADDLRSWQLGPLSSHNDRNSRRRGERS